MDSLLLDLFVVVLVMSPVEFSVPVQVDPAVWASLKRFNMVCELTDAQANYGQSFADELSWTRNWWRQTRNCPPITDVVWLPLHEEVRLMLCYNQNYRCWLERRRAVFLKDADELDVCREETGRIGAVLEFALTAANADEHVLGRRRVALRELRAVLGPSYAMPPAVPFWRFRETP